MALPWFLPALAALGSEHLSNDMHAVVSAGVPWRGSPRGLRLRRGPAFQAQLWPLGGGRGEVHLKSDAPLASIGVKPRESRPKPPLDLCGRGPGR